MFNGPGKYDKECTTVRELTGGGVVLIVFEGKLGAGFEVQASLEQVLDMPGVLRATADAIEREHQRAGLIP